MEHMLFTAITFLFFTALVGYISAKLVTSDDQNTEAGYFLAGKGLSGLFIAGSLMLTNISAEQLVGLNGQAYSANMSGMAWESTSVIATIVMALVFLPLYLRKGYTTLPEFLEDRFDSGVRKIISLLFLLGYIIFLIPVCLYTGAIGFNQIFDLTLIFGVNQYWSMTILIIALGVVGSIYAIFGGLKAVAVSDTMNGVILVISSLIIPIFGLYYLGGMHGGSFMRGVQKVLTANPEKLNAIGVAGDPVPFTAIFSGILLVNLFYWGTNQVMIQRTLGAQNLKEGQKGVLLTGFLKMLVPLVLVFPGILAFHIIPGLSKGDFAYPQLVATVLPWPLVGLFCAGLFGAIISTYNSFLNSGATIFMLDIYKPLINPNVSEQRLVRLAKIVSLVIAVFSIAFAPTLQSVDGIFSFAKAVAGFFNIPIITLVLVGMFTRWATPLGAKLAVAFHLVFYTLMRYVVQIDSPNSLAGFRISFIHVFGISFFIMLVIIYVTAKLKPVATTFDLHSIRVKNYDMRPWKFSRPISIWLMVFLVYTYLMLSPWGLATEMKNATLIWGSTIFVILLGVVLIGGAFFKKDVPAAIPNAAEPEDAEEQLAGDPA